jgi:hypothetical protein
VGSHETPQRVQAGLGGDFFVKSVMHHINPADHKLTVELLRNALGG